MAYQERYLGDGVYASFDGYHVVLDLRGQDRTTRIALEPDVLASLERYKQDVMAGRCTMIMLVLPSAVSNHHRRGDEV